MAGISTGIGIYAYTKGDYYAGFLGLYSGVLGFVLPVINNETLSVRKTPEQSYTANLNNIKTESTES